MSFYGKKCRIDGLPCGLVMRGVVNGQYQLIFERDYAVLEQIEAIHWRRPNIEGDCGPLPRGWGFEVKDIQYQSYNRSYLVTVQALEQYLGDVTGYQAQIEAAQAEAEAAQAETERLRQRAELLGAQAAEADETVIALYEALMSAGEQEAPVPPAGEAAAETEEQAPAGGKPGGAEKEDAE